MWNPWEVRSAVTVSDGWGTESEEEEEILVFHVSGPDLVIHVPDSGTLFHKAHWANHWASDSEAGVSGLSFGPSPPPRVDSAPISFSDFSSTAVHRVDSTPQGRNFFPFWAGFNPSGASPFPGPRSLAPPRDLCTGHIRAPWVGTLAPRMRGGVQDHK